MKQEYLAALDIGGTKITAIIADKAGILVKVYQSTKLRGGNKTVPVQADRLIKECCRRIRISPWMISSLGISTASPFIRKGKFRSIVAPNLCGGIIKRDDRPLNSWKEIPLQRELSRHYRNVVMDNDCVSAAIAERLFGAGKGCDNLVYVTWSTGIGTGAYVDGHLIRGKNGNAPHGGHIYLGEKGPRCGCGNIADLESLCSGTSIARDYGKPAKEVFHDYLRGNSKARAVVEDAAKNFGKGLASINAVLDTNLFIIGGSVFMNQKDILLPMVKREFFRSSKLFSAGVEFRPSALDDHIGDIAALSMIMPESWIRPWQKEKPWKKAPKAIVLG